MRLTALFGILIAGIVTSAFVFDSKTITGRGSIVTKTPELATFNAVELDFPVEATITVKEGTTPGLRISTYENIIDHIRTEVNNKTLIISSDEEYNIRVNRDVTVEIEMPAINGLSISGSSRAEVFGKVSGDKFKVNIAGSGSAAIDNLSVAAFISHIAGSGSVTVNGGSVEHSRVELTGSGRVHAFKLNTVETEAIITGSGHSEVSTSKKLYADITGSGSLKYKGHPQVKKDISGSGSVSMKE